MEKAQKRVLILIDDVDRLEKTEIHALFRLVKLTADFRYTSYLLAFDKNIVAASLQERYSSFAENAGEAFIEKIIQIPLHLPAVEKQVLREFCFEGVDEALNIAGITLSEPQVQDFIRNFSLAFDSCLTTPRKARLYGNSLMFSLPILKGEVNPVDLMLLEGIRIFCPPLYEVLRVNKVLFAGVLNISVYSDNNDKKEHIKTLVNKALDEGKNINKDGFIELLKNMFPTLKGVYGNTVFGSDWQKKWNNGQRICSENYYSRYFTYSIPNGDIPDQDIPVLIENIRAWGQCMDIETNPLNEYVNSNVLETLIRKLRHKSGELNEPVSAALAMAISQKSDEIPNPDVLYSWTTPFSQAAMLISDIVQNVPKSHRVNLVKSCISTAPLMEFKIGILKWLKQEDEAKPEVDTFSEASIDDIGKHLAEVISQNIAAQADITLTAPKSIPLVFFTLHKYGKEGFVHDVASKLISENPESLIRILDSYVPLAWKIGASTSHKSDFEREQYKNLTSVLDATVITDAIGKYFPTALEIPEEYPYYDGNDNDYLVLKQFVWLDRKVVSE